MLGGNISIWIQKRGNGLSFVREGESRVSSESRTLCTVGKRNLHIDQRLTDPDRKIDVIAGKNKAR